MLTKERIEKAFFVALLTISGVFFFQEYFYFIIPNHEPIWIVGIPLTIIGIIGIAVYTIWYVFRGKEMD